MALPCRGHSHYRDGHVEASVGPVFLSPIGQRRPTCHVPTPPNPGQPAQAPLLPLDLPLHAIDAIDVWQGGQRRCPRGKPASSQQSQLSRVPPGHLPLSPSRSARLLLSDSWVLHSPGRGGVQHPQDQTPALCSATIETVSQHDGRSWLVTFARRRELRDVVLSCSCFKSSRASTQPRCCSPWVPQNLGRFLWAHHVLATP